MVRILEKIKEVDKVELKKKANSIILVSLSKDILIEVDVSNVVRRFEAFYLKKGLNNCLFMLVMMF